jgi:hypothetical protein
MVCDRAVSSESMSIDQVNEVVELHRQMGAMRPPEKITQEAFEGDDQHLRRLAKLRPGEEADGDDLWEYVHDLRHTAIQGPLLAYLLPFCLKAWRDDLLGIEGHGGTVEHFYAVLADPRIFDSCLNKGQAGAVSEFMRKAILDEIDAQRGLTFQGSRTRPYRWFRALTTYGVIRPDLDLLWNAWWGRETIGRAIALVQYISCLMYGETENPIFAPWTPDRGGGPPCLWEFEGHLYSHRWLQPNVNFLRQTLNLRRCAEALARAVDQLAGQPEYETAATVRGDFPLCDETVEARCAELPGFLETVQEVTTELSWSR